MTDVPPLLGRGFLWTELTVGQRFRTHRRTVTEHDLMAFVALAGMQEPLFVDATLDGALGARPVPGVLTYALIEGMVLAGMAHGTGLALLESAFTPRAPVRVGDTIGAEVEVTSVRPTRAGGRGVVGSAIRVTNQRGETVMDYTAVRLMAGRT